jgi:hypothetical protein
MNSTIRALVGVLVSVGLAMPAGAQVADHLQCLKIKDALGKASYTATLTPTDPTFPAAPGCLIQVPAKLLCVDVAKTNVVGTPPPGPVVGAPTDKLLCYTTKCPKESLATKVTDQFGTHQVTVKGTGLLCAPAPTPTTTTTTLPPPYPAPHPALPQVVNAGGPVIAAPVVYPVIFANEDPARAATLTDFLAQFGGSTHWTATTAEYGIGAMTAMPAITPAQSPTGVIDDSEIQTWLAGTLNADDAAFPTADANTVFVLFYPAGATITLGQRTSCFDFGAYHSNTTLDAPHSNLAVPYVVVPYCDNSGDPIVAATAATSHELVEAVTDPNPTSAPAYNRVDDARLVWSFAVGGGELCDLCDQDPASFVPLDSSSYVVQRCWSNAAAAASHDPCVPAPANDVYFNAAPDLTDVITVSGTSTTGVKIPTGTNRTIPVTLFSDAATNGPISVTASDPYASGLSFAFDNTSGPNGTTVNLTITATRNVPFSLFILRATVDTTSHFWFGLVAQ